MDERDRGKWLRCPPCASLPHRPADCLGRDAGCCCTWCPGRAASILADARHRRHDPLTRELVLLASARVRRQQLADSWPQPARKVRCAGKVFDAEAGKYLRCPAYAESGRFGRPRAYCTSTCQRRAKWLRAKARREAVRGQVVTGGPRIDQDGRTGPPAPIRVPGPTREALQRRREREACASFGLPADFLDDLDREPATDGKGQAGNTAATGS
jgi:hypothetical protein